MNNIEEMREKIAKEIYADAQQSSKLLSAQLHRYIENPDPLYYDYVTPLPDWDKLEPTLRQIWFMRADQFLNLKTDTCHIGIMKNEPVVDEITIGVLQSLYDRLDDEKDLAEIKAIGNILDGYGAGFEQKAD